MRIEETTTRDSLDYDLAGNVIARFTERGDTISMSYDELGRLEKTVVSEAFYSYNPAGLINPFPLLHPSGLTIARDSSMFAYDELGNLVSADNSKARIRRSYTLAGLLKSDSLVMKDWNQTVFEDHGYMLRFDYDLDGRRVRLQHPGWLSSGTDEILYDYDPATGELVSVIDQAGTEYEFEYDDDGLRIRREFPGGRDSLKYDVLHRLQVHDLDTDAGNGWTDDLTYDRRDKVTSIGAEYSGLGHVIDAGDLRWGDLGPVDTEEFTHTGLGQQVTREATPYSTGEVVEYKYNYSLSGVLEEVVEVWPGSDDPPPEWEAAQQLFTPDASGNRHSAYDVSSAWAFNNDSTTAERLMSYREEARSFYSADQKLIVQQVNRDSIDFEFPHDTLGVNWGTYEEYWYDALGRRVLKYTYEEDPICDMGPRCDTYVGRMVWDGDQLLWELRQTEVGVNGGDAQNPPGGTFTGTISYVHAGGIDAPVGMVKDGDAIILHRNWRGLFAFSTDTTGEQTTCTPDDSPPVGCKDFPWPARSPWSYWYDLEARDTHLWYGSLPLDQIDETGLSYRRNRYYDGLTGQFTQEDPMGIAGGLNLFGYAGGDPINFADPFGLSPCDTLFDPDDDSTWQAWAECMQEHYRDEDARKEWESNNPFESWFMANSQCLASGSAAAASVAGDILYGLAVVGGVAAIGAVRASAPIIAQAWRAGAYSAATRLVESGNALTGQAARASGRSGLTRGAGALFTEVNSGSPSPGGFLQRLLTFQSPSTIPTAVNACGAN